MPVVRKRVCALSVVGLTLVAGCAQSPHVAAHVDGHEISVSDVDILGQALCLERVSSGQTAPTTQSEIRGSALAALIQSRLDAKIASLEHLHYDPAQLANAMQRLEPLVAQLPTDDQEQARGLINDLLKGQLQLNDAALIQLQQSGQKPTQELVTKAVQEIESVHADTLKVSINPEFTSPGYGNKPDGATSVSLATSPTARNALTAFRGVPSASYVASLPAAQKCG